MELIRKGKTKDIYRLENGNILLKFKNTVTGYLGTGESDPGGNDVVGEKEGIAYAALKTTIYYFELLKKHKINTHYLSGDLGNLSLTVRSAKLFGKGLEFVVRYSAQGSFVKRFGDFVNRGQPLPEIFEITLKDDARGDPIVSSDILEALKILTRKQYSEAEKLTKSVCKLVKKDLAEKGLNLLDIKVEVALVDNRVCLVDEISAGNMRVEKDGRLLEYVEVANHF